MMKTVFYFRKSMLGFTDWCKCVLWCRSEMKIFTYVDEVIQKERLRIYEQMRKVLKQYQLLRASLNCLQKKVLSEYLIYNKIISDKEMLFQIPIIYENWLEIVFSDDECILKSYSVEEIGEIILRARKHADYTKEQAAGVLGINVRTLTRYEYGEIYPKLEVFLKMIVLYEIDMNKWVKVSLWR